MEFLYFLTERYHGVQLLYPPATPLPRFAKCFTCVPSLQRSHRPGWWEQSSGCSAYLPEVPAGQPAAITSTLTPSTVWGMQHKPSSNLLMKGSPVLWKCQEIGSNHIPDSHFLPSTVPKCNYSGNACIIDNQPFPVSPQNTSHPCPLLFPLNRKMYSHIQA